MDSFLLVLAKEPKPVGIDEARALSLIQPSRFGLVARTLGQNDVVAIDLVFDKPAWVWLDMLITSNRVGSGKFCNDVRTATLQVPEVVKIAVRKDDESAILRFGILAGLFFAYQGVLILCLRLKDN